MQTRISEKTEEQKTGHDSLNANHHSHFKRTSGRKVDPEFNKKFIKSMRNLILIWFFSGVLLYILFSLGLLNYDFVLLYFFPIFFIYFIITLIGVIQPFYKDIKKKIKES